jgi:hypothetical protein
MYFTYTTPTSSNTTAQSAPPAEEHFPGSMMCICVCETLAVERREGDMTSLRLYIQVQGGGKCGMAELLQRTKIDIIPSISRWSI